MKRLLAFGAILALSGCASLGSTSSSTLLTAVQTFTAAETAFDAAVNLADGFVTSGTLSVATDKQIGSIASSGYTAIGIGRAAVVAGDASTVSAEAAALTSLVTQLATTHN